MIKAYYWELEEPVFPAEEELEEAVLAERRRKAAGYAKRMDRIRCLAVGVLLRYALAEWESVKKEAEQTSSMEKKTESEAVWYPVTTKEIRKKIRSMEKEPCFGEKLVSEMSGKPYFKSPEKPFFSLSHSGSYVLCAMSDCEIGADIQEMKAVDFTKAAEYAFCKEENDWVKQDRHRFYRIWTGKEAFGKMTGEGLKAGLRQNMLDERLQKQHNIQFAEIVLCKSAAVGSKEQRLYAGALCFRKGKEI